MSNGIWVLLILILSACKPSAGGPAAAGSAPVVTVATPTLNYYEPSSSPSYDMTPTFIVGNLPYSSSSATLYLYGDGSCSSEHLLSTGNATGATGAYLFMAAGSSGNYAASVKVRDNQAGQTSSCANLTYTVLAPPVPSSLTRISPSTATGYDDTPTIRVGGVVSGHSVKLYQDSSCTLLAGSGSASGSTIDLTSTALAIGTYEFHARDINEGAEASACSTSSVSYQFLAPPVPSGLSLLFPSTSPNTDPTPTILVSGLQSGVTVKLYTDSGCNTQVGSGNATGTTVQLTSSALSQGSAYNFYARTVVGANSSSCSTATVAYDLQYLSLPSALERLLPTAASDIYNYTKLRVSGVVSTDLNVTIYKDSSCINAVGSGDPGNTTVDILTGTLATGAYTFYARRFDSNGGSSQCSSASASYEVLPNTRLVFSSTTHFARPYAEGGLSVGDVNGDGKKDVFLLEGFSGYMSLGSGIGSYPDYTTVSSIFQNSGGGPTAFFDFDGDGDDDFISADWSSDKMSYRSSNGNGTFATKVDYATTGVTFTHDPNDIKVSDIDKDGKMDIILGNGANSFGSLSVYKGSGNGTFSSVVDYTSDNAIYSISLGDLNGDTYPDVVGALINADEITVYLNNGNGTFAAKVDYAVGDGPNQVELADLNNDGKLDIVALNVTSKNISVRLGVGDGTFGANTNFDVYSSNVTYLAVGDIDNDGNEDVLVTGTMSNKMNVLFGNGDGTLTPNLNFSLTGTTYGGQLRVVDLGGDGALDVVVPTTSSSFYGFDVFLK